MARKQKGQKTPNFSLHAKPSGSGSSKGKKLETYEDTLEPGSTDERELDPLGQRRVGTLTIRRHLPT